MPSLFGWCEQLQFLTKFASHGLDDARQPPAFLRAAFARNRRSIIQSNFGRDVVQRGEVRQAVNVFFSSLTNGTFDVDPQINRLRILSVMAAVPVIEPVDDELIGVATARSEVVEINLVAIHLAENLRIGTVQEQLQRRLCQRLPIG